MWMHFGVGLPVEMLWAGELTVILGMRGLSVLVWVIVVVEEDVELSYEERIIDAEVEIWFVFTLYMAKPRFSLNRSNFSARVGFFSCWGCEVGGLARGVVSSSTFCDCDCWEPKSMKSETVKLLVWELLASAGCCCFCCWLEGGVSGSVVEPREVRLCWS